MHFIRVNLDFFLSCFVSFYIGEEISSKELRSYKKYMNKIDTDKQKYRIRSHKNIFISVEYALFLSKLFFKIRINFN
jgi:hypothetical protein